MSNFDITDTIAAIASPNGPAERGIIRISGNGTADCLATIFEFESALEAGFESKTGTELESENGPESGPENGGPIQPTLNECRQRSVYSGAIRIDDQTTIPGQLMFWPDQRSFTRQPTAEFHMLGSPVLLKMTLAAICKHGARLAGPGEFTLRAFLSGRIDLTQAEAVLAVIDSANEAQLDGALQQLSGGLAGPLSEVRDSMLSMLAELEAGLDFVEEDIQFITQTEIQNNLSDCLEQLRTINQQIKSRNVDGPDFNVVLAGKPNAGKSSLFNALVQEQRAIVTDIQGTTRDYLSAPLRFDDQTEVLLIDTAGVEDELYSAESPTDSTPERASIDDTAQAMARTQIQSASLQLLCIPANRDLSVWHLQQLADAPSDQTIVVQTKLDLQDSETALQQQQQQIRDSGFTGQVVTTSSVDCSGILALKHAIASAYLSLRHSASPIVATTIVRVSDSIDDAQQSVAMALQTANSNVGQELIAAEMRTALDALGRVVGTIYTDDILDLVFGRFCIGK